ncbi:SRPBCC family protein [Amycolatopsis mongoliensis]|uniref:SRPBCC family protein n=1 Tax=Amycolatopsis mongoliensis TaxID=715475 RepID=A0A9Y2NIX5_9PSEU|nr:SRPBCC family protein [Amycolatopsis sp. 4-36]WIY01218.1 SRPBCC family protein [Amycolatopsis sp. 4-36]
MELSNTFTVNLPVDDAWKVLTDLPRVAPCLPGASLQGVEDDVYRGSVKIKVGPVSAQYRGTARFAEKDDKAHRAVVRAEGKDAGGQGNAAATVTMSLAGQGSGTKVDVRTQLDLSGRVAQFGRGVISDVTNKLIGQFVQRLEAEFAPGAASTDGPPAARSVPSGDDSEVEALDVFSSMGGLIAKRALPVVGGLVALLAGILLLRNRGGRPGPAPAGPPVVLNLSFPVLAGRANPEETVR